MSPLSEQARRVVEALLAGDSLDHLAPRGSAVRAEVEAHLIDTLETAAAAGTAPDKPLPAGTRRSRAATSPSSPPKMPGKGIALAFSDGASRGNPGPAAVGVRILSAEGEELLAEGVVIGRCTNNVAEYMGAIHALEKASELGLDSLELRMDSELVVKQLKGEYRVKQPALAELKAQVDRLRSRFKTLRWKHVPREQNREADLLANEALDSA
jgi:ribonuclease HI